MEKQDIGIPEAQDMILKYLVQCMPDEKSFLEIHKAVFPFEPKELVAEVMNAILNEERNLVNGKMQESYGRESFHGYFKATAITVQFLNSGGFSKRFQMLLEQVKQQKEAETLDLRLKQDQIRTNKLTRIIAVLSAIISLAALIISFIAIFKDPL